MVTLQQSPSCTKMMLEGKVEHHSLKPKATDYAAVFDELNYVGIVQRVDYMIASVLILTTSLLLEHWFEQCLLFLAEEAKHDPLEAFIWMRIINKLILFFLC